MITYDLTAGGSCRRPAVRTCAPTPPTGSNPVSEGMVAVQKGDVIDVGLDWAGWLKANAGRLKASTWGTHADTPDDPVLGAAVIDIEAGVTVTIIDLTAAAVGQNFYITNTVTIEGEPSPSGIKLPDRTLTRMVHVRVAA